LEGLFVKLGAVKAPSRFVLLPAMREGGARACLMVDSWTVCGQD